MRDKTTDKATMYTYAFHVVCKEMEVRGFTMRQSDRPTDETVVLFEKYDDTEMPIMRYALTGFPKPNDINSMVVSMPFRFLHLKGQELNRGVSVEMNLAGVSNEDEEIKNHVIKWLDALLPKTE
jgi:hypothetical protein